MSKVPTARRPETEEEKGREADVGWLWMLRLVSNGWMKLVVVVEPTEGAESEVRGQAAG